MRHLIENCVIGLNHIWLPFFVGHMRSEGGGGLIPGSADIGAVSSELAIESAPTDIPESFDRSFHFRFH
jgi:hypothetical protein